LFREALADAVELEIDNGGDLFALEAVEDDDLVDAIEKLGAEMTTQRFSDFGFALFRIVLVENELRADVGC
jgi:hypothetical protein